MKLPVCNDRVECPNSGEKLSNGLFESAAPKSQVVPWVEVAMGIR